MWRVGGGVRGTLAGEGGVLWWCELVLPVVGRGRGQRITAGSAGCSDSAVTHQEPPSLPQPRDCHVLLRNTQTHQLDDAMPLYVSFRRALRGHTRIWYEIGHLRLRKCAQLGHP